MRELFLLFWVVWSDAPYIDTGVGYLELSVTCLLTYVLLFLVFYCYHYSIKVTPFPYNLPLKVYLFCMQDYMLIFMWRLSA